MKCLSQLLLIMKVNLIRPSGIGSGAAAAAATDASTAEAGASNRATRQQQWVYERVLYMYT